MVDDQRETYTVELLREMKANHEHWVASSLTESEELPPIRVVRTSPAPSNLMRLMSGRALVAVLSDSCAYEFSHDDPQDEDEMAMLAAFLQEAQNYGDLSDEFEAGDRVRYAFDLEQSLRQLEDAGFWVFGAQEPRRLEGGHLDTPTSFPVAVLRVVRSTNPEIVAVGPSSSSQVSRPDASSDA
jgi:hypothetical protein